MVKLKAWQVVDELAIKRNLAKSRTAASSGSREKTRWTDRARRC
jgi:hypothetical protein